MHALRHCIHVPLQDEDNNITMQAVRVIMQAVRINQPPPTFNKLRKKKELLRSHTASPARHSFTSHGTASPATAQLHQPRHSFTSHGTTPPARHSFTNHGTTPPARHSFTSHGTPSPARHSFTSHGTTPTSPFFFPSSCWLCNQQRQFPLSA